MMSCYMEQEGAMADLIDRQAAIEVIDAIWTVTGDKNVAKVWQQIKDLPTAEPKKGKWIDFTMSTYGVPKEACGVCGEWSFDMGKNFCPNCGARMEGNDE